MDCGCPDLPCCPLLACVCRGNGLGDCITGTLPVCKDPGACIMTRVAEIAGPWLGLCRKPPALHALQMSIAIPPEFAHEGVPDGGSGGSGTIRRGIGAALSGMRTLNRNRQLLWFTLLAGLMLAGNTIGQAAFWYFKYNLH